MNVCIFGVIQDQFLLEVPLHVTIAVKAVGATMVNRAGSLGRVVGVNIEVKGASRINVTNDNDLGSMSHE